MCCSTVCMLLYITILYTEFAHTAAFCYDKNAACYACFSTCKLVYVYEPCLQQQVRQFKGMASTQALHKLLQATDAHEEAKNILQTGHKQ